MSDLEIDFLKKLDKKYNFKITNYYRYVDDTFLIIDRNYFDSVLMVFNN